MNLLNQLFSRMLNTKMRRWSINMQRNTKLKYFLGLIYPVFTLQKSPNNDWSWYSRVASRFSWKTPFNFYKIMITVDIFDLFILKTNICRTTVDASSSIKSTYSTLQEHGAIGNETVCGLHYVVKYKENTNTTQRETL